MSKEENSYSFSLSVPRQKTFQGKIPNFIPKHSKEKFLSFANTFRKFYLKIEIKRARWQTKDSLLIKNKVCHRSGFADFLGTCVARALFFPFSRSDENMFRSVLIRWIGHSATFFQLGQNLLLPPVQAPKNLLAPVEETTRSFPERFPPVSGQQLTSVKPKFVMLALVISNFIIIKLF